MIDFCGKIHFRETCP